MQISRKQYEAMQLLEDPEITELLLGGSAGGAKSVTMCLMITRLCKEYPGIKIFLGRKTRKSLLDSTVATLLSQVHILQGIDTTEYNYKSQEGKIFYRNGSLVLLGDLEKLPSDPDFARYGSLEIDCAFIDEAGEITIEAKNAIKSRVGRGVMSRDYGIPGKLVLSCNPSTNFLRTEYYDTYDKMGGGGFQKWKIGTITIDGEDRPTYRGFLRISAYDNPFLPKSYIDNLATLPDKERKRLLDGDWNYADDTNSMFKGGLLDKATVWELPKRGEDNTFRKFIGVDVSDVGHDRTIFTLIENGVVVAQKVSQVQMTWDKESKLPLSRLLADELIEFAQRNGFTQQFCRHIAVECNGVGAGIRDFLRDRGWAISEYVATHKSRSEGYYQLMLDFDSGDTKLYHSLGDLDEIRKELLVHTYKMNNQTPDVLKKEKIKEVLGYSPDRADSLMIANWCKTKVDHPEQDPKTNYRRVAF